MSRLKSDSELETARFRQAVYIEFCKNKNIPDPCGTQAGYERIVACFIKKLILDHNSRSATVHGYIKAINTLFHLHHFDIPADLSDHTNMCFKIIQAWEREENIARQWSPITCEMFTALLEFTKKSPVNSIEAVVADWFTFIRITGLRCAQYAQKTQSTFDEHEYPSGKRVVKAFIPTDWRFSNSSGALIHIHIHWIVIYESSRRSWKSPFESRRTGRMVNPSCLLPAMLIQIYVRSKWHIEFSSDPKDWTSRTLNQWVCSSTNLASPGTSREI